MLFSIDKNVKMLENIADEHLAKAKDSKTDDEYSTHMVKAERALEAKAKLLSAEKEGISKEIVGGVFSIAGILIVLNYEKLDVISSKAFNWIKR